MSSFLSNSSVGKKLVMSCLLYTSFLFCDTAFRISPPLTTTVGVCYRHQLVDDLPAEPHDRPVGCVVAG